MGIPMGIDPCLRNEFPGTGEYVHLNSAAMSLMSRAAQSAALETYKERAYTSGIRTDIRESRMDRVRSLIGELIHASPDDICLVSNTSEGLNIIAQGMRLSEGDNVVIGSTEYYGNALPWLNREKDGIRVKKVEIEYGKDPFDRVAAALDERTRVLAVSFVGWIDGFRHDLGRLGLLCRDKGILFIVDAVQGVGAMDIDVTASHVSFLACGGYKWLMSPTGTGFIYVNRNLLPKLDSRFIGHLSVATAGDRFKFEIDLRKDVSRFRLGAINDSGIAAMEKSLEMIVSIGIRNIQNHIIDLNVYASDMLKKKGYTVVTLTKPCSMSGILTFRGEDNPGLYRKMEENKITVSLRNQWIRISPHLYNTGDDIDRMLEVL